MLKCHFQSSRARHGSNTSAWPLSIGTTVPEYGLSTHSCMPAAAGSAPALTPHAPPMRVPQVDAPATDLNAAGGPGKAVSPLSFPPLETPLS